MRAGVEPLGVGGFSIHLGKWSVDLRIVFIIVTLEIFEALLES